MSLEFVLFFVIAGCSIGSALFVVTQRNPMMSAISLIANFFCLAILYLLLQAQLLAVLQIIVYTGAIMVLVVFVIMLLNLGDETRLVDKFDLKKVAGVVLATGFLLEMLYIVVSSGGATTSAELRADAGSVGTVEAMGKAMFSRFLFPFEITGLLLLVAIVGAVILAKKRI